jgi:leader peptidase (prepilin peptidase)/N-methyltransferase
VADQSLAGLLAVLAAPFVGSFAATLAVRLTPAVAAPIGVDGWRGLFGRSHCPACGHVLAAWDLAPVLSWVALGRRCRYCQAAIPAYYPAIELIATAIGLASALLYDAPWLWATAGLGWALLTLAATDFRSFVLPDALTLPVALAGLAVTALAAPERLGLHAAAAASGFVALAALGALYQRLRGRSGLGLGDAKLLAAAGAWLGPWLLPWVVLIASLAGIAAALAGRLHGRPLDMATRIPFGLYLAPAIWVVWVFETAPR